MADVEFLEQALHALVALCLAQLFAGFQNRHDVLFHRQAPEDAGLLGQVANPALGATVHGQVGDIAVIDLNAAGIGFHQPDNHVEAGGLAGAVGAQQADNLAGFHVQGDILDDPAALVAFCQVVGA